MTKLNAAGSRLGYSTYLGGSERRARQRHRGRRRRQRLRHRADTHSANFPTTAGAFDTTFNGGGDAFVTKLNAAGAALVYSTYLGGNGVRRGQRHRASTAPAAPT